MTDWRKWLFYVAAASGAVTFTVWAVLGDLSQAIERTVTVLVIACPHALGLAIPLTIAVSMTTVVTMCFVSEPGP